MDFITLAPFLVLCAPLLGLLLGHYFSRHTFYGGWRTWYIHKCGHTTEYRLLANGLCKGCGENSEYRDWKARIGRPVGVFGWEWKD